MPQSLSKIYIHLIFGTKNHEPLIEDHIRDELHRYMATILKNWESPAITIGSVSNHIHILFSLSRNHPVRKIAEEVKKSTSKWLKTKAGITPNFHWQNGYGAFSVSQSGLQDVIDYIQNQQDHHRHISFQEEYRKFLKSIILSLMNGMFGSRIIAPLQGLKVCGCSYTQGVALGYVISPRWGK